MVGDLWTSPIATLAMAAGMALGQQLRPDSDYDVVGQGDGAMPGTPIDRNVRIDYVQHVGSAMIRASESGALGPARSVTPP